MWYIYILLCQDHSLYTGYTDNVERRFLLHLNGKGSKYTRSHKPLRVVHTEAFATKSEALQREREIKKLTRSQKLSMLQSSTLVSL